MGGFFCSCGMGSENSTFLSFYISKAIKDRNYKDTPAAADARRKLFDQMDTDQSGEIDKKEAAKMWKCLKQALKELTKDGGIRKENSTISKAEFMEIYGKNDNLVLILNFVFFNKSQRDIISFGFDNAAL